MKARAIILASMLLVGCHSSQYDGNSFRNKSQGLSLSSETDASAAYSSLDWLIGPNGQYQDLWTYVGNGISTKIPQNSRVKQERERYTKNKNYLPKIANRAEPYMYWIVDQIQQRDMPIEIALLPIIESEFNPHAVSSAKAAGIWQIVPTTGLYYGLKQDEWYDGRQDPIASTKAALDLLQRLNVMFEGDWLLTIAAYNSGEGRVLNAIKENRAKGRKTDFWSLSLPQETSVYVPRLLALIDVMKNQKKYGIIFPKTNPKRALDQLDVGQQVELNQVAKMTGLPVSRVKSFNAGYKHQITPPSGPHKIAVPKSHRPILQQALAQQKTPFISQTEYTVKDGDNLDNIAQRHNSDRHAIIALNRLDGETAQAGSSISIPTYSNEVIESLTKSRAANEKQKTSVRKVKYTVVSGDSLSVIAKKLGVKTSDLKKWNKLKSDALKPKQTLIYFIDFKKAKKITYSVRNGDTMTSVAQKYGLDINDVVSWNSKISDVHRLSMGDELTLYVIK